MDILKQNLHNLGLTDEEISVYLSTLEHGSATILELARNTGIPRTTVYLLIDSLVEKKLLTLSSDEKKKQYIPASPDELVHLAQKRKEVMQETLHSLRNELPQLQALYTLYHQKPKVKYYEGCDEVQKLFEASLKYEKIYAYFLSKEIYLHLGEYLVKYRSQVMKKMIFTQEILSESLINLENKKKYESARNQIYLLPQKDVMNSDMMIYGNSIVYLTYKNDTLQATEICDTDIQYMEKIKFNIIWNSFTNLK